MIDFTLTLRSEAQVKTACHKLQEAFESGRLHEMILRPKAEIRTNEQNAMYWSALDDRVNAVNRLVTIAADTTGHTPLEMRQIWASNMPPEQAALMFVLRPEAAHEIIKVVLGVPTTTRLTKANFSEFYERMETIYAEIIGNCHV